MYCPNINDNDYKRMASVLGAAAAHAAWNANGGQPLHLNPDGSESVNFQLLQSQYGESQAMILKNMMLTREFQQNHGKVFQSTEPSIEVREGVTEVFDQHPQLKSIGTPKQYSSYLSTIFPDSKIKDIVYHGTDAKFDKFDKSFYQSGADYIYFGKLNAPGFKSLSKTIHAIINLKNPSTFIDNNTNKVNNDDGFIEDYSKNFIQSLSEEQFEQGEFLSQYGVKNPEQIHILGSKQDIEGFKSFVTRLNKETLIYKQTMTYDGVLIAPTSKRDVISYTVSEILRNKEAGRTLDMLIANIERSFPGLKVLRENDESAINKGHRNETGWTDAAGIHLNLDNISYQTPVHEVAHVFLHLVETSAPDLWVKLNNDLDKIIENNRQYDTLRKSRADLTEQQLRKEYMAMIAGYVSENAVRRALDRDTNIYTPDEAKNLFTRVKNFISNLWNAVTGLLSSHFTSDGIADLRMDYRGLESLFDALTSDILEGKIVKRLTQAEQQMLLSRYQDGFHEGFTPMEDTAVDSSIADPVTRVRTIADMPNILMNNEDRSIMNGNSAWSDHPDAFADMVYRKIYQVEGQKGFHLYYMGHKFVFPELPEKSIKNILKGEVLNYHIKVINAFPEHMNNIIDKYSSGGDVTLDDLIKKEFQTQDGNIYVRMQEVKRLIELMGGNDKVKRLMRLSDITTEYPKYAGLVDASLIGTNPIVVVHEDIDGLDISVSDLTMGDMGMADTNNTDNNRMLTSRFRSDYHSLNTDTKITWSNNKRDCRAAALTLTLAGMNHMAAQNNIKFKVRRAGVYGMKGGMRGELNARSIYDFKEAFDMVRYLMKLPEMAALVDNSILESVVADDKAWMTKNMQVSHIQELYSYYTTERSDQMISDKFRDDLLGKNMSNDDHVAILRRRMRKLEVDANNREDVLHNIEYQMLSRAVINLKRGWHVNNMNMRDVDKLLKVVTNPHNVSNGLIQYASTEYERSKSVVVGKAIDFNKKLTPLIEAVQKAKGIHSSSSEKLFDGMFPDIEVIVDKAVAKTTNHGALEIGDKIIVKQYNKIYSHSYRGKMPVNITEAELNLGDFILATVKEQYIQWHYNEGLRYNSKHTMKESTEWFEKEYTPGTIPVLPANTNQMFRSGNWGKWFNNIRNEMANGDLVVADMSGSEFHELSIRFSHQINEGAQMKDMGIVMENGKYVAKDVEALYLQSNNLEYSMKLFQMDMQREIEFNNNVLPVYNELIAVANHVKNATKNEMLNTRDYLKEYTNLLLYRKREEDFDNAGVMAKAAPVVRTVLQLNTFLNLGFRPIIWVKSAFFNEQNSWIGSLATDMSNLGVLEENRVYMPTSAENMKAHELIFTDFNKIWALALKMQLVNGSERDVMQNLLNTTTDKHIAKEQFAHWGNWGTDAITRSISMVGHMLHDGSYDAHIFDPKTGELSYDPKLDKRFFENGKEKEGWGVVLKTIQESQKKQGLMDGDKQVIGYEYEEINGRIKWYADKYLIGSMDLNQRTLLGNTYYGASLGQFRGFSWDKVWNFMGGTFTGGHMTEYGTRFKPFKDENGEWITVKDQMYMEGMVRSVWEGLRTIHGVMNGSKESWNEMPPLRRRNIMEAFIRLTLYGAFAAVFMALKPGDDDDKDEKKDKLSARDAQKLEFMFSDLLALDTMTSIYSNPVPAFKLVTDLWGMAIGEHRVKKMVRYVGPLNDGVFLYELISPNDQVIKQRTKRQQALDEADATRLKDRIALDDEYIVTQAPDE